MADQVGKTYVEMDLNKQRYDKGMAEAKNIAKSTASSISNNFLIANKALTITALLVGKISAALAGVGVAAFLVRTGKQMVQFSGEIESVKIRLEALTGSTEAGALVFKQMSEYAAQVPHTFQEILQGATQLSAILKPDEIEQWVRVVGDVAVAAGLRFQETVVQMQRALSGGIAAADMFRERGVKAMLGFKEGVEYTAVETRRIILENWNAVDSRFRGLANKLKETWSGAVSMMEDAWFKFLVQLGKSTGLFQTAKDLVNQMTQSLRDATAALEAHEEQTKRTATNWETWKDIIGDSAKFLALWAITIISPVIVVLKGLNTLLGFLVDESRKLNNTVLENKSAWEQFGTVLESMGLSPLMTLVKAFDQYKTKITETKKEQYSYNQAIKMASDLYYEWGMGHKSIKEEIDEVTKAQQRAKKSLDEYIEKLIQDKKEIGETARYIAISNAEEKAQHNLLILTNKERDVYIAKVRAAAAALFDKVARIKYLNEQLEREQRELKEGSEEVKKYRDDTAEGEQKIWDFIEGLKHEQEAFHKVGRELDIFNALLANLPELKKISVLDPDLYKWLKKYIEDAVGAFSDMKQEIEDISEASRTFKGDIEEALTASISNTADYEKRIVEEARSNFTKMMKPFTDAMDTLESGMTDTFNNIFQGAKSSFADLADVLKSAFIKMLAGMAAAAIMNPIRIAIFPDIYGVGGTNAIPGQAGTPTLSGRNLATSSGGLLNLFGSAGSLATSSSFFANLLGGLGGGGTALGALGYTVGSAIPYIGLIAGLGSLAYSIFGKKKKKTPAFYSSQSTFDPFSGETYSGNYNDYYGTELKNFQSSISDIVSKLKDTLGSIGGIAPSSLSGGQRMGVQMSNYNGIQWWVGKGNDVVRGQSALTDEGASEALAGITQALIKQFGGIPDEVQDYIEQIDWTNLETGLTSLQGAVEFWQYLQDFDVNPEPLSDAQQQINAINEQFDALIAQAKEYGYNYDKFEEGRANALARITSEFNKSIKLMYLQITDPEQYDLQALEDQYKELRKSAVDAGGDLVALERWYTEARKQILDEYEQKRLADIEERKRAEERADEEAKQAAEALEAAAKAAAEAAQELYRNQREFGFDIMAQYFRSIGDEYRAQRIELDNWYTTTMERARELGWENFDIIEQIYANRRQQLEDEKDTLNATSDAVDNFVDSLKELLYSMFNTSNSPLAPAQILQNVTAKWNEALGLVQAGDENAMSSFAQISQDYMDAARTMYASGPQYFDVFYRVADALSYLTGESYPGRVTGPDIMYSSPLLSAITTAGQTSAVQGELMYTEQQRTTTEVKALRVEFSELNSTLTRYLTTNTVRRNA